MREITEEKDEQTEILGKCWGWYIFLTKQTLYQKISQDLEK